MVEPIDEIGLRPGAVQPPELRAPQPASAISSSSAVQAGKESSSFKDVLAQAVGEVQRLQNEADTTIKQLVSGELKDVGEAMVAVERADVSFQTMMLMRNKIVAAYEEVMRMQV